VVILIFEELEFVERDGYVLDVHVIRLNSIAD